jgi:hypothetical protein
MVQSEKLIGTDAEISQHKYNTLCDIQIVIHSNSTVISQYVADCSGVHEASTFDAQEDTSVEAPFDSYIFYQPILEGDFAGSVCASNRSVAIELEDSDEPKLYGQTVDAYPIGKRLPPEVQHLLLQC